MTRSGTRTMTFQATRPDAYAALLKAARSVGLAYQSGDAGSTVLFTSGTRLVMTGAKVAVQIKEAAPGTVEVTMSQPRGYGMGWPGRHEAAADRLSEGLSQLLPRTG